MKFISTMRRREALPPLKLLLLSCFFLIFAATNSNAADTINTDDSLTDGGGGGGPIVSSDETFELGFFRLDPSSPNRYLGIWYKKISVPTFVWVANRDTPITNTSTGILTLTQRGILTLSSTNSSSNILFWSSNSTSSSVQNPIAQLLETGNLVVRDAGDSNPGNYLWQSFDHPGNTMLPGMKHGKNFVTGVDRVLSSWKSTTDPSRGSYTFRMDTHGYPQQFLESGSKELFRSGPWNGLRWSGSPGLDRNQIYTYGFVFNQEEVYYKFELINSSVYSRLVLEPTGVLQRWTWNYGAQDWNIYLSAPADNCDTYGTCGDYGICNLSQSPPCGCLDKFVPRSPANWRTADWTDGCVRRTPLNCENGDGFIKYSGIKVPDTRSSWYDTTMTREECHQTCLRNCTCMAYADLNGTNGGSGCLLWFGRLIDIRHLSQNGQEMYIRMASSELDSTGNQNGSNVKKEKLRVVSIVVATVLLLGLILTMSVWYMKKKKKKEQEEQRQQQQELQLQLQREGHSSEQRFTGESNKEDLELPLLDLATIAKATKNFSVNNKLGEGGFGPVYKGTLEEGQEIAVKRLSQYSSQGLYEFKNEVILIAKLQHRNLVKLLGCCIQGEEKMLVYEYMPNNSLDSFIFDENRRTLLDWRKCFNIINGIARGLLYLHQDCPVRIIHRDLKAANVLLDADMNPKISDFGMARSFVGHELEANTQKVVGTYGYMSPEYAVDGVFSVKSDVFSFGVLVLEIVSGKRNRGFFHQEHHHNLLGHAWMLQKEGRSLELVDINALDSCNLFEVLRSIHVACLCVQQNPEDRPSMSSVVLMLGGEGALPPPKEPGFFTERNLFFGADSSSSQPKFSANELSITLLDAR